MLLQKKRVRNVEPYLQGLNPGEKFYVGITHTDHHIEKLIRAGFTPELVSGETILPAPEFGAMSVFNAEGKYLKLKHLPMETAYRLREWRWTEFGGNENSKIVEIPYKRYQREFVKPPCEELSVAENGGNKIVLSRLIENSPSNYDDIKHIINLFLSIFRECELLKEDLIPTFNAPIRRLNWTVLPEGRIPWNKLVPALEPVINRAPNGNRPIIRYQLHVLNDKEPDFVAVGQAGFRGYLVFGFTNRNIFILESIYRGNATYVFNDNWKSLSQFTKAEILNSDYHHQRFFHRLSWENEINQLFN